MFGFSHGPVHRALSPAELQAMLARDAAIVVDVREQHEFGAGHIPGAHNLPLSRFDPALLPDTGGKLLVLSCAGGNRSASALGRCAKAAAAVDTHLAGGLGAWIGAGLPVEK